jgi:hypothetical protein
MGRLALLLVTLAACGAASSDPKRDDAPAPAAGTFTKDAYDAHIAALQKRLVANNVLSMQIRIEDPFVVLGNGTAESLERNAQTVRWAVTMLEQDFFAKRPGRILDIFLFEDARSYEMSVRALTGKSPTTPYGFYSRTHNGLFMNIATGGGTLIHELVHPYVEADFPDAPAWLNEGLGSLFEQSGELGGHIVGRTNWRLAGLQAALGDGGVATFKTLTHLGDNEFYGKGSGTHYAQARYLMYYLQEKGLLRDFYRKARAARTKDPSGYQTLVDVLGEKDMAAFQIRWAAFVSALEFP